MEPTTLNLPGQSSTLSRIHETSAKFQRYKILLRRRWWFLLLTASIGVCFQALRITSNQQQFVSLAKLVAGGRMVSNTGGGGPSYVDYLQDFYGTIIETLESAEMRRHALERVRALNPDLKESDVDVKVSQNKGSAIFNVAAIGSEPKFTRVFLDSLLDEFRAFREQIREQQRNKALTALAEDVVKRQGVNNEKADKLATFKKNNNVVVLMNGQNQAAEFLKQVTLEKNRILLQLSDIDLALKDLDASLQQRQRSAQASVTPAPPGAPAPTTVTGNSDNNAFARDTNAGFTQAEKDYMDTRRSITLLKADKNEKLKALRPQHPDVLSIDEKIAKAENILSTYQAEIGEQLRGQKADIERRITVLDGKIQEFTLTASEVGGKLAEYQLLEKDFEDSDKAYKEMFDLVHKFQVNEEMQGDYVSIMERASTAVEDVQPWIVPIMVGLGAGLCAGGLVLLLFDRLDDRMNSFSEFQTLFPNEAILGQVPEQRQRGDVALLRSNDDRHLYAEAFRNVRSSLLFKNWRGKPPKTILVTSAVPNEGKTTVTSNLAITMALAGARVLLADCDLRRGGVAELFKMPVTPGLSEVLRGKVHWRDAVQETGTRNLDLLPRGEVFDQTSEMLLSQVADEMLREMGEEYDYVIFDSAPVLVADDTASFAPKIDCILFVVRMSSTMARLTAKALDLLYDRQVKVGGVILNRSSSSLKEYTYYNYASYYYTPKANTPSSETGKPS
jgi:capsular exopolysaccharide synthesis family protein